MDCHVYIPWMTDIYTVCMMAGCRREGHDKSSVVVYYGASSDNFSPMSRDHLRSLPAT